MIANTSIDRGVPVYVVPRHGEESVPGAFSLFPVIDLDGPVLTQERLTSLSRMYSRLYVSLIGAVAPGLVDRFQLPARPAEMLAREAIVPLTHCFMDRLMRLDLLSSDQDIYVEAALQAEFPDTLPDFKSLVQSSAAINQRLVCQLAPLLGIPVRQAAPAPAKSETAAVAAASSVNHNFDGFSFLQRLKRRILMELHKRRRFSGRIPVLSMAYASGPLAQHGFYSSYFHHIQGRFVPDVLPRDDAFRRRLFQTVLRDGECVFKFLDEIRISNRLDRSALLQTFIDFLISAYPASLLESVPSNFSRATEVLREFKTMPVINSEVGNTESLYLLAAAKGLKMTTIGCQHGGHYGYIEDHVMPWEVEYPYFDYFITWGWRAFPDLDTCRDVRAIPLPSPWLSERRLFWKKKFKAGDVVSAQKSYDFLLMTNKVYPFPPAPSGAAICRSDHVKAITKYLSELVAECAARGVRVLHKPYSLQSLRQWRPLFDRLERLGGAHYKCLITGEKGMSYEMLRQSRIVLWDQPGTGLIECLVSGIPTMVLWPRVYSEELPSAQPLFDELSASGLIHSSTQSLLAELDKFKASPDAWMREPLRRTVIEKFCSRYGWADEQWHAHWKKFLTDVVTGGKL